MARHGTANLVEAVLSICTCKYQWLLRLNIDYVANQHRSWHYATPPPMNPVSCIAGPEDAAILAAARILISPLPVQAISWTIRSMTFSSVTPASRQTCRSCCGHCVQKIAGHRRSGAQRFWVGDDVIRCLVYRSALICGVTLSETRTVLQSSSSSSVTMKLVISDDFSFLQQGTGHEEIAQNSVSLESELSIFPPAAPCPFPSCLQPSRLYGSRPPRRSQPAARWTHSDLAMAQRILASIRPDVL